uniref:CLU central domain-containing protein n=1 Tax=Amphimedon queenslandica TaxID=400682 RepID=A0A1X7SZP4_AMPQE
MSISFSSNSVTHMCTTCGVSKVSLLREFCNKTGVQITLKDYKFSLTAPFNEGDLACIVPVVKHTDFKAISYQHKTVIMYERLLGVDHCSSISAYYWCGA